LYFYERRRVYRIRNLFREEAEGFAISTTTPILTIGKSDFPMRISLFPIRKSDFLAADMINPIGTGISIVTENVLTS